MGQARRLRSVEAAPAQRRDLLRRGARPAAPAAARDAARGHARLRPDARLRALALLLRRLVHAAHRQPRDPLRPARDGAHPRLLAHRVDGRVRARVPVDRGRGAHAPVVPVAGAGGCLLSPAPKSGRPGPRRRRPARARARTARGARHRMERPRPAGGRSALLRPVHRSPRLRSRRADAAHGRLLACAARRLRGGAAGTLGLSPPAPPAQSGGPDGARRARLAGRAGARQLRPRRRAGAGCPCSGWSRSPPPAERCCS